MCCHMFPPAHIFPSGLGNIPVTDLGGSPFPHGGMVLDMGRCPASSVAISPTADVDTDASIAAICASTGMEVLALLGKNPL